MAEEEIHQVPECVSAGAHLQGMHNYLAMWEKSVTDPAALPEREGGHNVLHKPV